MKRVVVLTALALTLLGLGTVVAVPDAHAQATRVQQDPQVLNFASNLCTATGATPTCSITVPSGQWVYVTGIEITLVCGSTTCTAIGATNVSTANLGGLAFTVPSTGNGAAAGTAQTLYFAYNSPLKSAAPGTTTSVGAAPAVTNGTWRINVYGYFFGQ